MTSVVTADHGAVRVLTMNRPEARNALNRDLIEALFAALVEADTDPTIRAVVLTGTDPAFCAGVDLKEAQRLVWTTSRSSRHTTASPSPRK